MVPIYYFSAQQIGSVTEQVAHKIGQATASVPIRIQVTPKYPNDWHQLLDRVQAERAGEQPLTVHPILVLSQAEPLLICYPNWQNHLPPAVTWWLRRLEIKGRQSTQSACMRGVGWVIVKPTLSSVFPRPSCS